MTLSTTTSLPIKYGRVINLNNFECQDDVFGWCPDIIDFKPDYSINVLSCKKRSFEVEKLERHKNTKEIIVPIDGNVLIPLAIGDDCQDRLTFSLSQGQALELNESVWHFIPYPQEKDVNCLVIFKQNTGLNDIEFKQLS